MLATRPSPATPLGARDRALLLVRFGAALRRSELAGLRLGDVTPVPGRGLRVLVRRSKTDQRGAGQEVAVWANPKEPGFCPLAALEAWLVFRRKGPDITGGTSDGERRLFVGMSKPGRLTGQELWDKAVWRLVKGAAEATGLDGWERFSGHLLRAGLATAAGEAGADLAQVMRQTRHRSADVALGYLRPADLWRNNPTMGIWGEPEGARLTEGPRRLGAADVQRPQALPVRRRCSRLIANSPERRSGTGAPAARGRRRKW